PNRRNGALDRRGGTRGRNGARPGVLSESKGSKIGRREKLLLYRATRFLIGRAVPGASTCAKRKARDRDDPHDELVDGAETQKQDSTNPAQNRREAGAEGEASG